MVVRLFSAFIFLLTWPWHRCFVEPINEPIRSNPIHIFPWISFGQNYPKWSPFVMVKPGQTSNVDGAFTHGKQPRKLVYLMVKPWVLRMTSWFFQRVEWQAARLRILGLAPGWRKDTLQGSGISRCRGRGDPKKWVISMGIYWDYIGISPPGTGKITIWWFPWEIMGIHGLNLAQIWRFHGNSWD